MAKFKTSFGPTAVGRDRMPSGCSTSGYPRESASVPTSKPKKRQKAEEDVKKVEVQNLGWRAAQIDDRLRLEALDASERLAPYGVSLTAVVTDYIRRRGSASSTVDELAELFLASRTKLQRSKKHLISQ